MTLKNCTLKVWLVSLCLFISSGSLLAAELTNIDVQRKGKRFYMDSTLLIDAPVEAMYSVLTDYNSMHQFSRGIVHSQDVTPDSEGKPRVYTHIRGCVAFLCRSIERVERLDTIKNKQIIATLDPSVSKNVAWNISTWDLEALDLLPDNKNSKNSEIKTGTRIRYRMEFEPDFWVPPLIGGYLVKKSLSKDGLEIMTRMEAHAQGNFPIDTSKNKTLSFPKLDKLQTDFVLIKKPVDSEVSSESDQLNTDN